jgi:hypothetical protein
MRDFILTEIARLAQENGGKAPGINLFASVTGITKGKWCGVYWVKWSDALADAGLAPNQLTQKLDSELMLEQLAALTLTLGHAPTEPEIRMQKRSDPTIPSSETIRSHFGSAAGLRVALRNYATKIGDQQLLDVLPTSSSGPPIRASSAKHGFVYLLKSGPNFKIGRTDTIARRVSEIRTTLPEAVEIIHSIKTDDPAGIEAYWHRRFAEKRLNGEWFALSAADVKAFLRRSFQ